MILRKPYAILIRHFRLLHAILAIFTGYLVYRTNNIVSFISDYIGSSQTKVSIDVINELFNPILFVVIVFILLFTAIVMAVLNIKEKPIKFYIYNIISHLYVFILYIFASSIIGELQYGLVEIKTLKLVQDFTTAALGFQIVALVIVTIRAIGFDIKGFNFKEDLAELEITEKDNEEFEVNLDIDTDKLKRNAKKRVRYAKYIYLENMFFINIVLIACVIVTTIFVLSNINVYSKTYKKAETFKTNEFMIQTNESYVTKTDYRGNSLMEDESLVVVRISLKKLYGKKSKLNTGRIILKANNQNYYHITEYNDELKDLGNTYTGSKIGLKEYESYILVFKVHDVNLEEKMQLRYTDTTNDVVKITVEPENLNEKVEVKNADLGIELKFSESILKNTILKIEEAEIADSFKLNYKYCAFDNCYDAVEYVNVSASDNYDKTLLKLKGTIALDETLPIVKYSSLFNFINEFTTLKYKINGTTKKILTKLRLLKPTKAKSENTYFIEVSKTLKEATSIQLEINVRNKVYNYTLK